MAEHPLLIFPTPSRSERARRWGGGGGIRRPSPNRQAERLTPRFDLLQSAMDRRRAELRDNPLGVQPEKALVLETVGTVEDFTNAMRRIDGLEWLGEVEDEDVAPDHGFEDESNPEKQLRGRLFLMMSNQQALGQMRSLFEQWHESPDKPFPYGLAKLKGFFDHLYDIRPWGPEDRIRETGLVDDWQARLAGNAPIVPFEAELWFRDNSVTRQRAEERLVQSLDDEDVQRLVIPEIAYHAILGRIPADRVRDLIERPETRRAILLFQNEEVMYVRPVGQCAVPIPEDDEDVGALEDEDASAAPDDIPNGAPIVALFDGLPLAGHRKLNGRLVLDDPDGYDAAYQANQRFHGTTMSSLICHGDLNEAGEPINRKLYARPIMKPQPALGEGYTESIPDDILTADLIHRAVRRLFESENGEPPAAPSVRVVNLSIGNPAQPFAREMSSTARLLDWLSHKYNVLFVVSAGNHTRDIKIEWSEIESLSPSDRQDEAIKSIAADTRNRRLLSPAETLNGLTVGASHHDASQVQIPPNMIDPFIGSGFPSIVSAHGPGYRRAIKPDVLFPGGKQILRESISSITGLVHSYNPPGQRVAVPGATGRLNETMHTRGTSNAAALASRAVHFLYDVIEDLREGSSGDIIPQEYDAVLLKTLLVHGANWDGVYPPYQSVLRNSDNGRTFKDYVGRFIGYGTAEISRAMICTDQRVTLLGVGALSNGEADEFTLPLPPSLSSKTHKRRLTITMAWLTPVNARRQSYRVAHLWFNPKEQTIAIAQDRKDADYRAVQRGTVQHEILEGRRAVPFQDGDNIVIKVNCRSDAGEITEPIRYGLAATLEIAEGIDLPIYQEVRDRIEVRVRPRA